MSDERIILDRGAPAGWGETLQKLCAHCCYCQPADCVNSVAHNSCCKCGDTMAVQSLNNGMPMHFYFDSPEWREKNVKFLRDFEEFVRKQASAMARR